MSTPKYIQRIVEVSVAPPGEPLFSKKATAVRILDEAASEFVEVEQQHEDETGRTRLDPAEWPAVRAAINQQITSCRSWAKEKETQP